MGSEEKTPQEFCGACGWPLRGMRCEACGVERIDLHLRDATLAELARDLDPHEGSVDKASEAFRNKEWTRFVGFVVAAAGGSSARTTATADGPGWIASIGGAGVFVTLFLMKQEIAIEAPVVRLPRDKRVPVMRAALELSSAVGLASHASLRDDLLLLRTRLRLGATSPELVRRTLVDVGKLARSATDMLATSFRARPALPASEIGSASFDGLGAPRKLAKAIADDQGAAVEAPRAAIPMAPLAPSDDGFSREPRPRAPASMVQPSAPLSPKKKEQSPAPPPAADAHDSIPPILAPLFAMSSNTSEPASLTRPTPPPAAPRAAARPGAEAPSLFLDDKRRTPTKEGLAPKSGAEPAKANGERSRMATLEIEAVGADLEPAAKRAFPSGEVAVMPADRLCALLKRAELLAAVPVAESSAIVPWLVRAAVFRAVYEFKDSLPDAVALLARTTGIGGRGTTPVKPEVALAAFERLVSAKGAAAKDRPVTVDPLTSAQQAKDHVSRYIAEIERSASDPGLRHYLALGALCELLVRAKLPAQTSQRLRDIIGHAQREGARPPAIDLLMTALRRISA